MAQDIADAVKNKDQTDFNMEKMNNRISNIGAERIVFMKAQDKIRVQIQDFEQFLDESRAISDR